MSAEGCAAGAESGVLGSSAGSQRSVNGDLYHVSCSRLSCSAGIEDGRRVEFRKCVRTRATRSLVVFASLVLLDLTLSAALVSSRDLHARLRIYSPYPARVQPSGPLCVPRIPLLPSSLLSRPVSIQRWGERTDMVLLVSLSLGPHRGGSGGTGAGCADPLHQLGWPHLLRVPAPHRHR